MPPRTMGATSMNTKSDKVTGGCLCGAIRYEAEQAPFDTVYCHCRMCQKGLGSLFGAAAVFKHAHFCFVSGEPAWYRSSNSVTRGFCGQCGSPIAWQRDDRDYLVIWIGTLDQPEKCKPKAHTWTESKIPWVDIHSDLPEVSY